MDAMFEAKFLMYAPIGYNYEASYETKTIYVERTGLSTLQIWHDAIEKANAYADAHGFELDSLTVVAI